MLRLRLLLGPKRLRWRPRDRQLSRWKPLLQRWHVVVGSRQVEIRKLLVEMG